MMQSAGAQPSSLRPKRERFALESRSVDVLCVLTRAWQSTELTAPGTTSDCE